MSVYGQIESAFQADTGNTMMTGHPGRRPEVLPSEARCERCGETFTPADASDLMHFQTRAGDLCGGDGVLFRPFVIRKHNRS
jgi:hypothetical protein